MIQKKTLFSIDMNLASPFCPKRAGITLFVIVHSVFILFNSLNCVGWETNATTNFHIKDDVGFPLLNQKTCQLSGLLNVDFVGRIMPHENSVFSLLSPDVKSMHGKFEKVKVSNDWICDVEYDYQKPAVILRNFHPPYPPAFPEAEGFGKFTKGGRGGRVYEVTHLGDKGPGSFRAACEAQEPRIVVFRTSGTINLESRISIKHPFITIAGQTAPGDGICIKNYMVKIDTDQVIIRYMRFRPGDEAGIEQDGFGGEGNFIMIDHCSVSWGIDETFSINKGSNLTVQWCMITESLYDSIHKKGKHGYGGLWGGPGGSWHHNILAHHSSRNPRASGNKDSGLMDYRNNVVYNWGFNSAYGGELWPRNWVNNYYKYGPATQEKVRHRIFIQSDARGKMYADGNYVFGFPEITTDNWKGIEYSPQGDATEKTLRVSEPFVVAPVRTQAAEEAFMLVLKHAGASLSRDAVDRRIIEEIRTGTATYGETWGGGGKGIINSQKAVGGWPLLQNKPAPLDSDHDGMPDDWEESHGLDPENPKDGSTLEKNNGYTHLEEYINSLIPVF